MVTYIHQMKTVPKQNGTPLAKGGKTMANTTKKATDNKANKTVKETKNMATKKVEKEEVKKVESKKVENKEKKNIDMQAINKLLTEAGIKIYNPEAKGKYRIFGSKTGSSLNVQAKKFIIFSTNEDFKMVEDAKIEGVKTIEGDNSQDKCRPNTVIVQTEELLKKVLKIYAKNVVNQIAA